MSHSIRVHIVLCACMHTAPGACCGWCTSSVPRSFGRVPLEVILLFCATLVGACAFRVIRSSVRHDTGDMPRVTYRHEHGDGQGKQSMYSIMILTLML